MEPILQKDWVICSPYLYFNLKNLDSLNSSSLTSFQSILPRSVVILSVFFWISWNQREGTLFLAGNQFCRASKLFGPSFRISIFKIWRTKIFHHSSHFNTFYASCSSTLLSLLKFLLIKEGRPNFLRGTNSAEGLDYLVPPFAWQF